MKLNKHLLATGILSATLLAGNAFGAVSAEQAAKLGDSLTPMGAEKAGNGNEIPAWDGGLATPPAGYKDDGVYVNPFPDEKRLFTIDQSNVEEYADKLSPGQIAMINRYDGYEIPVYKTHRSAVYPEQVMSDTVANATTTELIKDGNGLGN